MFLHFRNVIQNWPHRKDLETGDGFPTQAMQIPMSLWDYMLCKMMWKCICAAARAFWSLGQNDEQVLDVLILDIYDCFSCRMCIWHNLFSLSVWFSLSLCIYISPHVFDSNGWFISIHKSCLWECSIHLTDICETLLLMFCQDMIGHLFHLCIETFGLPADVDSQPLDVTLFRTANITRWPGYKRNISYKTYINHICFFFN